MFHGVPYSPFYITSFTFCKDSTEHQSQESAQTSERVTVQASDPSWSDGHAVQGQMPGRTVASL